MCGIAGLVGAEGGHLIEAMTDIQAHRGPDGRGTRTFASVDGRPPCALGHRRLSIIDPTPAGAQPMTDPTGRYWITYNGEIYNFRALQAEMAADGHAFASECDTEVLLALFARLGPAMVHRLNGIFAFAIWDDQTGEVFLARDRLGVKPLYYAHDGDRLAFASELKALLPVLGSPSLKPSAVLDFLTFLWVPEPETLVEGVLKLPAGHTAHFSSGRLSIAPYWDLTFAPAAGSDDAWAECVRDGVNGAVGRQMVSDVPIGSFLSGGLDSSAIVAEMARIDGRVTTYTVGFSAEDLAHEIVPDDVKYSREMARRFPLDYHEEELKPDVVDLLPKLIWHQDEPVADPALITTYLICRAARKRMTVVLSGMGGDEVFAGYPRHLAAQYGRVADLLPRSVRHGVRGAIEPRLNLGAPGRMRGPRRNLMKLLRGIDADPETRYLTYCSYYRPDELPAVLSPELRAATAGHDPFRHHKQHFSHVRDEHWLNRLLYVDAKTFLPCLNLAYTDKMSMAASTEVRVPLLDDEVVQLASTVPPALKLRRTTRKYVFKRSMEGILPKEVIWRPKAGFGAPIRSWLTGDLGSVMDEALSPEQVRRRGLLDPAEVQRIAKANASGQEDNALRLWSFLTLELWQQTFLDRPGTSPLN